MALTKHIATAVRNIKAACNEYTQALTATINSQFASAGTLDRSTYWAILISLTAFCLMFSMSAHAETDGTTLWGQFKGLFFGPYGLLIGAVMLVIAVFGILRNGFGWGSMIFGMTAFLFLIPGITKGLQGFAATIAA